MNDGTDDDLRVQISPHGAVVEIGRVLWHLRSILAILLVLFVLLSSLLMTGVVTGSTVYGIQVAAQRAGLLQR